MSYAIEKDMYPDVMAWLDSFLKARYSQQQILVRDCSSKALKRILQDEGLTPSNKPEWLTFNIKVDVCGFILKGADVDFAFVECKNKAISLIDISQLIGYSKVALPVFSCIVSPFGMSSDVSTLLETYNRQDVLEYDYPTGQLAKSVFVATWSKSQRSIDYSNVIPRGRQLI